MEIQIHTEVYPIEWAERNKDFLFAKYSGLADVSIWENGKCIEVLMLNELFNEK